MNNDMTERQIERRHLLAEVAETLAAQLGDGAEAFRQDVTSIIDTHCPAPSRAQMRSFLRPVS